MKRTCQIIIISLLVVYNLAHAVTLRKGHPVQYEVKPGDTLWAMANKFLDNPVEWPVLFNANPNIHNPNKIYPGQILTLEIVNGHPALRVQAGGTVKLNPEIRSEAENNSIDAVPYRIIAPFLTETRVLEPNTMNNAATVVAQVGEHIAAGDGDQIYIQGLSNTIDTDTDGNPAYSVFRFANALIDPITKKNLGYIAMHLGNVEILQAGNPATAIIVKARKEIIVGDKVLPYDVVESKPNFELSLPSSDLQGQIIYVLNGMTQIGQYQIVVINLGQQQGVKVGNMFSVYQAGKNIPNLTKSKQKTIQLPDEYAGDMMIFRVFDQVSFGLVMQASRPIHLLDNVRSPNVG